MTIRRWVFATSVLLSGAACSGVRDPPSGGPARAETISEPAPASPGAGSDLDALVRGGESAYGRAEYDSARSFLEVALTQARARRDSANEASALTWLGLTAWRQGEYARARTLGEQGLALKIRAGFQADLFRSYNALGLLAADEGRLAEALLLYEKAAEVARANADQANLAKTANNRALVYDAQGKFAQARAGYAEARNTGRNIGDARTEGRALTNLAGLDVRMGNPGPAIRSLREALALLRSVDDRTGEQNNLGQLGTAYDALGEPGLAFAALDSALSAARKQGLRQEEASDLELIAGLHRQAGDLQRALRLYDEANRLNGRLGLAVEQGTNLRNAAEIQATLGRPDLARDHALEALRIHQKAGVALDELRDHLLLADLAASAAWPSAATAEHLRAAAQLSVGLDARIARIELGVARAAIADRTGDARGVLRALHEAEGDLVGGGFSNEWQAWALKARAYAKLARLDSAVVAGREAVASVERVRGGFGSSYLRTSYAVDKARLYGDLVDVLLRLGRTVEAFEVADGARSHALLEHLAATSDDAAPTGVTVRSLAEGELILRRIERLVARLDSLEEVPPAGRDLAVQAQARDLASKLAEARTAYETLLVEVAERDAAGATLLGGRRTRAKEVQRALGPGEAVLEYLVGPTRVIVFVVTRDEVRSVGSEIASEDLARRVRLARDLISEPGLPASTPSEVLTVLHSVLMAPVERAGMLRGVRRLIVVPHSVLAYLPFAALRREGTGRYLMEEYAMLHLPSAAALAALRGPVPVSATLDWGSEAAVFAPFPRRLPGSLREARAFLTAVGGGTSQEGTRATESRLREALSAGGIVHIASHAVMNPRNPMFSRIELAAGSGGAGDDGRLEVHELLGLRITAPLVFLSGCETGVGGAWSTRFARGEDYATLAQAFLYAGARSVAATLWPIGDDGAAAFAHRFYTNLRTRDPAEALALAQREILGSGRYPSPYYWAAYQVIGGGESMGGPHRRTGLSVPHN